MSILGTGPLPDGAGERTHWLARFDSDGTTLWSAALARGEVDATTVAMVGDEIVVAGAFTGTAEVGGASVTAAGASDLFVAAFDADGGLRWVRTVALDGREQNVLAASGDGQVVIAATAARPGASGADEEAEADLVLLAFDEGGEERWRHVFGGEGTRVEAAGLEAIEGGGFIVAAKLLGSVDLGGEPRASAGEGTTGVVLARFDADGGHVWSQRFASEHDAQALALADWRGRASSSAGSSASASTSAGRCSRAASTPTAVPRRAASWWS